MGKIYLNELSLEGQFKDMEEFLNASMPVMRCMKFIRERNRTINKHSAFYTTRITEDQIWHDLRAVRGDDRVRKLKSLLLSITDNPPFWDCTGESMQDYKARYMSGCEDVSSSSVAEAAEAKGILLSFRNEKYNNRQLDIIKNGEEHFQTPSAVSLKYMTEQLWCRNEISFVEFILGRYEGTRLDFSKLEPGYGFEKFEKQEKKECIEVFDRFVQMGTWDDICRDKGLRYKKYQPSSISHDWFRGDKYIGLSIDKFRCINPKRCFGYRENDVFYVLRMERDHKISDYG